MREGKKEELEGVMNDLKKHYAQGFQGMLKIPFNFRSAHVCSNYEQDKEDEVDDEIDGCKGKNSHPAQLISQFLSSTINMKEKLN